MNQIEDSKEFKALKECQVAFIAPIIKKVYEILKEKGYIEDDENEITNENLIK